MVRLKTKLFYDIRMSHLFLIHEIQFMHYELQFMTLCLTFVKVMTGAGL